MRPERNKPFIKNTSISSFKIKTVHITYVTFSLSVSKIRYYLTQTLIIQYKLFCNLYKKDINECDAVICSTCILYCCYNIGNPYNYNSKVCKVYYNYIVYEVYNYTTHLRLNKDEFPYKRHQRARFSHQHLAYVATCL